MGRGALRSQAHTGLQTGSRPAAALPEPHDTQLGLYESRAYSTLASFRHSFRNDCPMTARGLENEVSVAWVRRHPLDVCAKTTHRFLKAYDGDFEDLGATAHPILPCC